MIQVFCFVLVGVILAAVIFILELGIKKMCRDEKSVKWSRRSDQFLLRLANRKQIFKFRELPEHKICFSHTEFF